ncbi:MAG: repressor LexA, partial [Eggerthellaceae bacterium]|nr:repressor LexA [Eggerthellaceae bacterium]
YIKRDSLKSRSIVLIEQDEPASNVIDFESAASKYGNESLHYSKTIEVPVVGDVAAGIPILAEQNITDTMTLPIDIVGDSASFILNVHGDSMIEAGINNGDYVVVRQQQTANNGDIVVALIDGGATVKTFYKESNRIRLQPENSSMDPIYSTDCTIAGKVVAVFRRL